MEFKFKSIIFFLLTVVLLSSCTDDDAVDPTQTADLGIEITVSDEAPNAGTNVTFTLTATNNGPLDATEVTVVNKMPSGYTYVSMETTSGEYDSKTGNWAIEGLDNETTATLTIVGTVNASGDYQNKATISGNEKDIQPANNSAMVSVAPKAVTNDMLFQYTISDAPNPEVTITGLSPLWQELDTEEKYHITIPTTLEGYPVTVIGNAAFEKGIANLVTSCHVRETDSKERSAVIGKMEFLTFSFCQFDIDTPSLQVTEQCRMGKVTDFQMLETRFFPTLGKRKTDRTDVRCLFRYPV